MLFDDLGPHLKPRGDVDEDRQHHVGGEEGFGEREPAVGGVVEGPFEPLGGFGHGGVAGQVHDIAGERRHPFAAHGVALVGHGAGAHLTLAERFFDLLHAGQEAHVGGHLRSGLGDAGKDAQHEIVDLAGVGLARKEDHLVEAHGLGHAPFQLPAFGVVAVEEFEETRLCARRPLDAAEGELFYLALHPFEVEDEVLQIKGEALAHGSELGGLEVGEAQRGLSLPGVAEFGQLADEQKELAADDLQALTLLDELRVVGDVAAGGAQMDDGGGLGAELAQGPDVAHDVVPELLFDLGHPLEVDVFEVGPEFGDLGVGDGQSEGLLVLGQGQPQPPPGGVFVLRRPDAAHFLARIASGQRIVIGVVFAVHKSFPLIEVVGIAHTP